MDEPGEVTRLLSRVAAGDASAYERLTPVVYDELRRIAGRHLARERPGHTLQSTALVHETFLKLVDLDRIEWQDRVHFFALASRLMRQVLIDHAVRRGAAKRGGGAPHVALSETRDAAAEGAGWSEDMLALDQALTRLAALDERQARVVECRFFAGLTIEETAGALGVSAITVKRDWRLARAWLNRELS